MRARGPEETEARGPEEKRTPQTILFEIAATRGYNEHHNVLNLLFDGMAKDLPDEFKLAWLARLGEGDKEKFCSLLNTLQPELVSRAPVTKYDIVERERAGHGGTLLQEFTDRYKQNEDFIRLLLEYGADPNFTVDPKLPTPIEEAFSAASYNSKHLKTLNVFLEFVDLPADKKMEYIQKVMEAVIQLGWQPQEQDDKLFIDLDCFKKQLSSLSVTEVEEKTISVNWANERAQMNFLQLLATKTSEMNLGILQLLLDHGLNPMSSTEEVPYSALEIAASVGDTTEAFNKLATHCDCEESHKKSVCQLLAWSWKENQPGDNFSQLLSTIPATEVGRVTIREKNLLQYLASNGKTPFVLLLLQHGVDPDAVTEEDSETALYKAWQNDHIATMGVLAEVADASLEMRTSNTWALMEKEQERRWQREVMVKLNEVVHKQEELASKQEELASVVDMLAKKVGIDTD